MTVNEILGRVNNVGNGVNYWFVRTTYGEHFDEFTKGDYIAIGWDYFTLDELKKNNKGYITEKIAITDKLDRSVSKNKGKVTAAYNKINTFLTLKKNDIVVVPSRNSDRLAFGRVADDEAYEVPELIGNGTHFKRRRIEWLTIKNIRSLNPVFFQVKSNQHSISNINRFAPFIDKEIGNLFKKGEETHFVLNILKDENINFEDIRSLMDNIDTLIHDINKELKFDDNLEDFFVKISLQSRGSIELIKAGKSLAILAFLLSVASCGNLDNQQDPQIRKLIDKNRRVLDQTAIGLDTLKINPNELLKPFSNGK
ncbi:hypothetical protein [Flavobacterium eburneipallidum]|uniref:hypothetical protein n=1 Tax=Flavobacterium eburneipallidum TaxID=3003263 RepID=UPI002482857E|nr:hypothetical protein [Flavobacterium eburneipallidum]